MHELEIFKDLIRNDMKKEYLSFEIACEMFTNIINEVNKLKIRLIIMKISAG